MAGSDEGQEAGFGRHVQGRVVGIALSILDEAFRQEGLGLSLDVMIGSGGEMLEQDLDKDEKLFSSLVIGTIASSGGCLRYWLY